MFVLFHGRRGALMDGGSVVAAGRPREKANHCLKLGEGHGELRTSLRPFDPASIDSIENTYDC